ncbi:MAG: Hsp20/alpha crystallin family protein [Candidatus Cloacimonetes bacterium]|nr:Hsp20/alpha crystallin family protein [Candidatus Cloacimonadota bacterium]
MLPTVRRANGWGSVPDVFGLRREMQDLLDAMSCPRTFSENLVWSPAINVRENDEQVTVEAELPGVRPDDVDISVENGMLSISGEKRAEQEKKDENWHVMERRYGRFERTFTLPRGVDVEAIRATFDDGVLRIEMPKREEARPRRIRVDVSRNAGEQTEKK